MADDRQRLVFGVGPVRELVDAAPGSIEVLYVAETRTRKAGKGARKDPVGALADVARRRGIRVEERRLGELDAMVARQERGARHQGVVAVAKPFEYGHVDDMLEEARRRGQAPLLVALDRVTDPRNLGAIVRSAYVLGAHGVIIPSDRAAEVTPVAVKSSAGATEHLPIAQVTNLARTLAELKEAGLWNVAVAAGEGAQPIQELDATLPVCLVLGSEATGIRPLVQKQCDFRVLIPMAAAGVGSLNVSVAAGIALYEVARQRRS